MVEGLPREEADLRLRQDPDAEAPAPPHGPLGHAARAHHERAQDGVPEAPGEARPLDAVVAGVLVLYTSHRELMLRSPFELMLLSPFSRE